MVKLSLIIATYNRSAQLLRVLRSVANQTLPPEEWECVVVDNNSKDDTQAVFSRFASEYPTLNLRCVTEERQGLSHARNRGIAESCGEYIAIIDDDEYVNPEFLSAYAELFDCCRECEAAGGRVIPEYPAGRPPQMSRYVEVAVANPTDWGRRCCFPSGKIPAGGNMAFRRRTLERYGGFDPALGRSGGKLTGGEESDLFERMRADGMRFYYLHDAVIWHVIPPEKTTEEYLRRLAAGTGASQRRRAELHGRLSQLWLFEIFKWCATVVLWVWYAMTLRPGKGRWLMIVRRGITGGIYGSRCSV